MSKARRDRVQHAKGASAKRAAKARKPYAPPRLIVHGTVEVLTGARARGALDSGTKTN